MENQSIENVNDLKDSIIDRIHYLAEMGDYINARNVYEDTRELFVNAVDCKNIDIMTNYRKYA